jgi:DUF4097 and DUF4098 domain-containing protein YvlB
MAMSTSTVFAQDFEKSYDLTPGATISVDSVSGDIHISGYSGKAVLVKGLKEGHDKEKVQVIESSTTNRLELRVQYPSSGSCNASIRFEIQVPEAIEYNFENLNSASGDIQIANVKGKVKIKSASGDVAARNLMGQISVSTASGDVTLDSVVGSVNAKSASGDLEVAMTSVQGSEPMTFSSASGDVTINAPANLDAEIEMRTVSGDLHTDFPLTMNEIKTGGSHQAIGRIGNGSRKMQITTVSGDVKLKQL